MKIRTGHGWIVAGSAQIRKPTYRNAEDFRRIGTHRWYLSIPKPLTSIRCGRCFSLRLGQRIHYLGILTKHRKGCGH